MVATVAGIHLGIDTHANRPAADTVPDGSQYSCSTHGKVYKSNFAGNSWADWLTVPAAGLADQGVFTYLDGTVGSAPATPASGKLRVYAKTGKVLAIKDDAGVETVLGQGIADQGTVANYLDFSEVSAPATPGANKVRLYAKSDGSFYQKDDAGTETGLAGGGGGGGLTAAYVGYNTVGGSSEAPGNLHVIATKITTTGAVVLQNIAIHATENGGNVTNLMVGLWADNSSTLGKLLAVGTSGTTDSIARDSTYGWIAIPCVEQLAASTSYWIGFMCDGGVQLKYDTSGSDRTMTSGGWWLPDGSVYSQTDTTKKYSIRGLTIA